MIQIKKPKYEHDNYCTCCRKPFEDSMEVSFSHKNFNDSVLIMLCGKCRRELMEALSKADSNSALNHIHNVVAENEYKRGYKQAKEEYDHKLTEIKRRIKDHYFNKGYDEGHKEGYERGKADAAISASILAKRITAKFDNVLSVADVLEELEILETVAKGEWQ